MTLAYIIDENRSPLYKELMLHHESHLTVWRVGEPGVPPISSPDPDILVWCEEQDCILVTNNRASMPQHLKIHLDQGRHMPGIFILKDEMTIGETIEELILIAETAFENEYQDRIAYLPISYD